MSLDGAVWSDRKGTQNHAPTSCCSIRASSASPCTCAPGAVEVQEGEAVSEGQKLLTLEAMKMEHMLTAPFEGREAQLPHHLARLWREDFTVMGVLVAGAVRAPRASHRGSHNTGLRDISKEICTSPSGGWIGSLASL
jgi:hypothetical protein